RVTAFQAVGRGFDPRLPLQPSLTRGLAEACASARQARRRLSRRSAKREGGRNRKDTKADVAQLAERVLGKDEVTSSILVIGSRARFDLLNARFERHG